MSKNEEDDDVDFGSLGATSLGLIGLKNRNDNTCTYPEDEKCSHDVDMFAQRPAPTGFDFAGYSVVPGPEGWLADKTITAVVSKRPVAPPGLFAIIPQDSVLVIFKMTIRRPKDRFHLALTSRWFTQLTEYVSIIAHTAAAATRPARIARNLAQSHAEAAKEAANSEHAKDFPFEDAIVWRGCPPARSKKPSGLGEFTKHGKFLSAGSFQSGEEHGFCVMHYEDGSRFAGELVKGQRHGFGVQEWKEHGDVLRCTQLSVRTNIAVF